MHTHTHKIRNTLAEAFDAHVQLPVCSTELINSFFRCRAILIDLKRADGLQLLDNYSQLKRTMRMNYCAQRLLALIGINNLNRSAECEGN